MEFIVNRDNGKKKGGGKKKKSFIVPPPNTKGVYGTDEHTLPPHVRATRGNIGTGLKGVPGAGVRSNNTVGVLNRNPKASNKTIHVTADTDTQFTSHWQRDESQVYDVEQELQVYDVSGEGQQHALGDYYNQSIEGIGGYYSKGPAYVQKGYNEEMVSDSRGSTFTLNRGGAPSAPYYEIQDRLFRLEMAPTRTWGTERLENEGSVYDNKRIPRSAAKRGKTALFPPSGKNNIEYEEGEPDYFPDVRQTSEQPRVRTDYWRYDAYKYKPGSDALPPPLIIQKKVVNKDHDIEEYGTFPPNLVVSSAHPYGYRPRSLDPFNRGPETDPTSYQAQVDKKRRAHNVATDEFARNWTYKQLASNVATISGFRPEDWEKEEEIPRILNTGLINKENLSNHVDRGIKWSRAALDSAPVSTILGHDKPPIRFYPVNTSTFRKFGNIDYVYAGKDEYSNVIWVRGDILTEPKRFERQLPPKQTLKGRGPPDLSPPVNVTQQAIKANPQF